MILKLKHEHEEQETNYASNEGFQRSTREKVKPS